MAKRWHSVRVCAGGGKLSLTVTAACCLPVSAVFRSAAVRTRSLFSALCIHCSEHRSAENPLSHRTDVCVCMCMCVCGVPCLWVRRSSCWGTEPSGRRPSRRGSPKTTFPRPTSRLSDWIFSLNASFCRVRTDTGGGVRRLLLLTPSFLVLPLLRCLDHLQETSTLRCRFGTLAARPSATR